MTDKGRSTTIVTNRKARFEYFIEETFIAGMVLTGTEVKSLREGKASLQEAYCFLLKGEVFIKGMNINIYEQGSYNNHEPTRTRKLLLKKREISKIQKMLDEKGMTLVPLRVFFNARNLAKMAIGVAKGKKLHDKRHSLKERESEREMRREMRN
jgi:SsrA-binding protein